MAKSRGGGLRREGRQTIRGRGNGRSSRTVLTGHKYGEAGKVNRHRLREERLRRGREAHFTTSDTAAVSVRRGKGGGGVKEEIELGDEVGEKVKGGVGGGRGRERGRSRQGNWNNGMSRVSSRVRFGVAAPAAH